MTDDHGFQVDLEELAIVAGTNLPRAASACRWVEGDLRNVAALHDDAFDDSCATSWWPGQTVDARPGLYADLDKAFETARSGLQKSAGLLGDNLETAARAVGEIRNRYYHADGGK